jgi:hypothetical protein
LLIDFSAIVNCNIFSVVPSSIAYDNLKKHADPFRGVWQTVSTKTPVARRDQGTLNNGCTYLGSLDGIKRTMFVTKSLVSKTSTFIATSSFTSHQQIQMRIYKLNHVGHLSAANGISPPHA